jgi:glutamate/tyrosine decarboxylase-like PLP-dependent enzyme
MIHKNNEQRKSPEFTLDPDNWESFSGLSHKMIDDIINHFINLKNTPAWKQTPAKNNKKFLGKLPLTGKGEEKVYKEFLDNVLPYSNGNLHPRFWGWVQGNGFPLAMMSDMLASGMNPHMAGFNQAPALVEKQVMQWMVEMLGLPHKSSGILVSGGTMANITSLLVARNNMAGFDIRKEGLSGNNHPKLVFYGSTETHRWAETAAEVLGLGRDSFRRISIDANYKINCDNLKASIENDIKTGNKPFCVIANAGTINTGAIDPLRNLHNICKEYKLWFHIDGAYGALIKLVKDLSYLADGLELADSLAFDLHKWMYFPFEIGCTLFKDEKKHLNSFKNSASYISKTERGVIAGGLPFAERGIELTRGFKALKVWMALKAYGINKFAQIIKQNVDQARYLKSLIEKQNDLELSAPVELNVVCFRYKPKAVGEKKLNKINQEILLQLQEKGIAVPSGTLLGNKFVIRAAIVNHRSRFEDFDTLINSVLKIGRSL